GEVYDTSRPAATIPWTIYDSYIVTNTKGTDGNIANVDKGQYWNTDAKNDSSSSYVSYANFAGKQDTSKNSEARFPDGDYEIHIVAGDLVRDKDYAKKVRVNNFTRTVQATAGGILPPEVNAPLPFAMLSNAPWITDT